MSDLKVVQECFKIVVSRLHNVVVLSSFFSESQIIFLSFYPEFRVLAF